jgi:hypothetical protein
MLQAGMVRQRRPKATAKNGEAFIAVIYSFVDVVV